MIIFLYYSDKLYRAYIGKKNIEWFNKYMTDSPFVDIWLSARLNKQENQTYKYFSEFRITSGYNESELINQLIKNDIKLEVLIQDLNKNREKRFNHNKNNNNKRVVGKYVSYNEVKHFKLIVFQLM